MSGKVHSVTIPVTQHIRFPQQCVYCLGTVSEKKDKELKASHTYKMGTKEITRTYTHKVRGIPLCQPHAALSDRLSTLNTWIIIISIVLGIGAAVVFQVSTHWVVWKGTPWTGRGAGFLFGTLFSIFILIGIGKVIAGIFNREFWVAGASGGTIGLSPHLRLSGRTKQPESILMHFSNADYAKIFCKLNGLAYD